MGDRTNAEWVRAAKQMAKTFRQAEAELRGCWAGSDVTYPFAYGRIAAAIEGFLDDVGMRSEHEPDVTAKAAQ